MKKNQALNEALKAKLAYRFERTWKLFTAEQLAEVLCISKSTAYRLIKQPDSISKKNCMILDQHIRIENLLKKQKQQ